MCAWQAKPEVLEWAYRKPLILAEVQEAQADVLCFQELNYFDELAAELGRSGYRGSFLAKQRSAALKYSSPADGIAIFWRADRFHASAEPRGVELGRCRYSSVWQALIHQAGRPSRAPRVPLCRRQRGGLPAGVHARAAD